MAPVAHVYGQTNEPQALMCDINFFEHRWHARYNPRVVAGSLVLPWPSTEIHTPVHTASRRDPNTFDKHTMS